MWGQMEKSVYSNRILVSFIVLFVLLCGCNSSKKEDLSAAHISTTEVKAPIMNNKEETKSVDQVTTQNVTEPIINKPVQKASQNPPVVKEHISNNPVSQEKIIAADKIYDQGFQIYISRNFDEAIKYFDKAIRLNPNCFKAITFKGAALCFKGNYNFGMKLIDEALLLKPDFAYCNFNKAMAFKLQMDNENALIWFDKTISFDSKNTWSYFGKSTIYAEWNDALHAVEELKKAIEIDPGVKDAARNEHDFDNVKDDPDFIKLLK